jgi:hypothetical protein
MANEPQPYEEFHPGSPMDIGHEQAVPRTNAPMTDERVPAIFEGAFEFDGVRVRVDVLERPANGAWGCAR